MTHLGPFLSTPANKRATPNGLDICAFSVDPSPNAKARDETDEVIDSTFIDSLYVNLIIIILYNIYNNISTSGFVPQHVLVR